MSQLQQVQDALKLIEKVKSTFVDAPVFYDNNELSWLLWNSRYCIPLDREEYFQLRIANYCSDCLSACLLVKLSKNFVKITPLVFCEYSITAIVKQMSQLQVQDALNLLDKVKATFVDAPMFYVEFLDMMKDFKNGM